MSSLPAHCRIEKRSWRFSAAGTHIHPSATPLIGETLGRALRLAQESSQFGGAPFTLEYPTVGPTDIAGGKLPESPLAIVQFNRDVLVSVQASRLDVRPMFKGVGSTYWIAGMTGALGISLCDWMINNGARSIAITSRKPEILPEWVDSHRRKGATIMVMPW